MAQERPLDHYRRMRDFERTPEPPGSPAPELASGRRFVVQEHHARALHWDFRLEHDGVLASWAVPKGIPQDPRQNRLAVQTEDHPLEYLDFGGEIPEKEYGAGRVKVWDRGTYELHKWREGEVMITLNGERARGKYVLFRTAGKNWMMHRMDPPADPQRESLPERIRPMLATPSRSLPAAEGWAFEVKWDGIRAIAYIDGGRARFESRNGNDLTPAYPELRALGEALGSLGAVLDGEIVAFDDEGRPSFERLQRRSGLGGGRKAQRAAERTPVHYQIFDLLHLDGRSTLALPYRDRRRLLESLELAGPAWGTPAHLEGDPPTLLGATAELRLEGVVAKRLDAPYEPGKRSGAWVKVKNRRRELFVVGGWIQRENARRPTVGALLLGHYQSGRERDKLNFSGRVGTGLSDAEARSLGEQLESLATGTSPFGPDTPIPQEVELARPEVVVEVEYLELTNEGLLRQPSVRRLRTGIAPDEVTR